MREYISREAAKTIIERLRDKCGNDEMAFALNWASRLIRDTPAADVVERPRWIPVTERFPEDGIDVLCWISNKRMPGQGYGTVGCYNSIVTLWDLDADWASSLDITYWMPLPPAPEPPKEEV